MSSEICSEQAREPVNIANVKPYGIIYCATNKVNGKRYVGQTTRELSRRRQGHIDDSKRGKSNIYFGNALHRYGGVNFEWSVIDVGKSQKDLNDKERHWISLYSSDNRDKGYNLREGGSNGHLSQETKDKLSISAKARYRNGFVHPMKGKTQSIEHTRNHAAALLKGYAEDRYVKATLGKARSKETKDKIRRSIYQHLCLPHRDKNKAKTLLGFHNSPSTEFPSSSIRCIETGKVYASMSQAAKEFGISHTNFSRYFAEGRDTVAGFHWEKVANSSVSQSLT